MGKNWNEILPNDKFEKPFWKEKKIVAGIDEAGRGPLAGPVCAAAIILPENYANISGIKDSKKLTHKDHIKLFEEIKKTAVYSYEMIDNKTIDKINILQATQLAMKNAVMKLENSPDFLLVDGNYFIGFGIPYQTIVKGDSKSISIAAASIIAKVKRDNWMIEIADTHYPEYGFGQHKGYATKKHFEAIDKYGICPLHRKTFLRKYFDGQQKLFE
jgi:ribonuclease HII